MFLPILCSLHGFINDEIISSDDLLGNISQMDEAIRNQMIKTDRTHTYEEQPRHSSIDFEARIMFYVSQGMSGEQIGRALRPEFGDTYMWDYCALSAVQTN
jgi:hypothetical protein